MHEAALWSGQLSGLCAQAKGVWGLREEVCGLHEGLRDS
jgi:hypothetical protein